MNKKINQIISTCRSEFVDKVLKTNCTGAKPVGKCHPIMFVIVGTAGTSATELTYMLYKRYIDIPPGPNLFFHPTGYRE